MTNYPEQSNCQICLYDSKPSLDEQITDEEKQEFMDIAQDILRILERYEKWEAST